MENLSNDATYPTAPNNALNDDYERYYNKCETANRIPLTFDLWVKAGTPC